MSYSRRVLTAAFIATFGPFSASAQGSAPLARRLDSIAGAEVRANRSVGITAAAYKGTDQLLLEAYGKADVEGNAPMTTSTIVAIGSATKQFTAVAILQLQDQGRLSVDDAVTKWLPELNLAGNRVTLRHLLAHTAGIVELHEMPEVRALQLIRNASITRDSVYKIVTRYPPAFPVGTMEIYSNAGFWLLGRIIEKVSGMTYEEYVEKRIFSPLGMSRSMYCERAKQVPDRALGYGIRGGKSGRVPDISYNAPFAAGALCSTAEDLITWLQALHGGKVLSPTSYAELIAPAKLSDGTALRYGMGTVISDDANGVRYIGHSGGGFGYSSETRWYPDEKLAVVVLTNSEPDAITMTADAIAAAVLPPPPRAAVPFTGDPSPLLGNYKGPSHGRDMVVVVTHAPESVLLSTNGQPAEALRWVERWTFRKGDVLVSFRAGATADRADELRYDTGGDHFILKRVSATAVTTMTAPLTAFVGTYEGQNPGTTVTIAVENDTLRVLPSGGGKGNLIPASGTTFYSGREAAPRTVTFNLGPDGRAVSMTLKAPGSERTLKRLP
jgi:CubicO group peptidase (beta-lactamase class C family)